MTTIFDGTIWTSYSQLTLTPIGLETPLPDDAFIDQRNGLCGGAVSGALFLVTGTHTGEVPVRVVHQDQAPAIGDWEEIVEVDFPAGTLPLAVAGWAADPVAVFTLPEGLWRARWSASGMDAGHQNGTATADQPAPDRYELALWPTAHPSPDAILRRTGETAGYWHDQGFPR